MPIQASVMAVITARKGSKRLKNKNLLPLHGMPLVEWTLQAAKQSKAITNAVLSTDCPKMQELALKQGIQAPFLRPEQLANDKATSVSVVRHAIEFYRRLGREFDYVMLLQPTSPMRSATHIDEAFDKLQQCKGDAMISVCETEHSPIWCGQLGANQSMDGFLDSRYLNARSQDLPTFYRLNGAIYIAKTAQLEKQNSFFLKQGVHAYIMSQEDSVDLDTKLDFKLAELLMREQS
jgi:CMP-N-acetylneuraminic acid synthetase